MRDPRHLPFWVVYRMKGQALVETAIIAPFPVFLLIGLLEVGYALNGYLILTSSNREAARFAARKIYLEEPRNVYSHTLTSLSGQLDFKNRGVMLLTVIEVENHCTDTYTVTVPLRWAYPYTPVSRIDFTKTVSLMKETQYKVSCMSPYSVLPPHQAITVEMWYEQPQLFGFPLISNPLTDPVPMYAHSTFRVERSNREWKQEH